MPRLRVANDRSLVVARLKGGLGNQLFQYAAGLSVALALDAELALEGLDTDGALLQQLLATENLRPATPAVLRRLDLLPRGSTRRSVPQAIRRRVRSATGRLLYLEQGRKAFAARPRKLDAPRYKGVLLSGYFQHPSWYSNVLVDVSRALRAGLDACAASDVVRGGTAISFRRGDYIPLNWELPMEYYERALGLLPPTTGPIQIVSDDPAISTHAASWLGPRGLQLAVPPSSMPSSPLRDLAVLAFADSVIMSNSTFCWWGVMAGNSTADGSRRTIIAPASWIDALPSSTALISEEWVRC